MGKEKTSLTFRNGRWACRRILGEEQEGNIHLFPAHKMLNQSQGIDMVMTNVILSKRNN